MKKNLVSKILTLLGVLIVCLFLGTGLLIYNNNKTLIDQIQTQNNINTLDALDEQLKSELEINKKSMKNTIRMVAKNSSLLLLNYNIEALKESLIFDMNPSEIVSIVIYDSIMDDIFLIANKYNNSIEFSNALNKNIKKYKELKDDIFIVENNKKNIIGEIILYYDEKVIINEIEKKKDQVKKDIKKFDDQINSKLNDFFKINILISFGLLATILFVSSILLIKYVNTPLKKLESGLNSFFLFLQGKKTNLNRITIKSNDEFENMANSLNENIQVSAKLHNQIKELNLNLEQKIETRTIEYKKEKQKALDATKAKSEFLANISHEIRTPMNGIMGLTDLVLKTELDDKQKEYLVKSKESSNILLHVINDILDLSKIESGKFKIEKREFYFRDTLKSVIDLFSFKIKEKGLDFEYYIDSSIPEILVGDGVRIQQILNNLISNAVKFTHKGFIKLHIELKALIDDNVELFIVVEDSGIGISKETQKKLFSPFEQGDNKLNEGTGLGLVISKQLIGLMDGEVFLKSEIGSGSKFSFIINLNYIKNKTATSIEKHIKQDHLLQINANALLVEDNEINQLIIKDNLIRYGLDVTIAQNGLEAIEQIKNKTFDIIFMDIQMPVMNGIEAAKKIRELKIDIPIVALTASAMEKDKQLTLNAGMNEHVSKPIEWEKIEKVLEKYFDVEYINTKENFLKEKKQISSNSIKVKEIMEFHNLEEEDCLDLLISFRDNYINYKKTIDEIKENKNKLDQFIHLLKGVSGNLRLHDIHQIAKTIKTQDDPQKKDQLLKKLQRELNSVIKEIELEIIPVVSKVRE